MNIDITKETHLSAAPAEEATGDIIFFFYSAVDRSSHCVAAGLENVDILKENSKFTKSTTISGSLLLYMSAFECIRCYY